MKNINTYITDTSDNEKFFLQWDKAVAGTPTDPITLRLHNGETIINTTSNLIRAVRGDLLEAAPAGEDAEISKTIGSELVSESWLEARVGTSGAYTALNAWTSKLDLGAISAGAYATFQVRLNTASDAATINNIGFALGVASL